MISLLKKEIPIVPSDFQIKLDFQIRALHAQIRIEIASSSLLNDHRTRDDGEDCSQRSRHRS